MASLWSIDWSNLQQSTNTLFQALFPTSNPEFSSKYYEIQGTSFNRDSEELLLSMRCHHIFIFSEHAISNLIDMMLFSIETFILYQNIFSKFSCTIAH